jgi:hypothetical protein
VRPGVRVGVWEGVGLGVRVGVLLGVGVLVSTVVSVTDGMIVSTAGNPRFVAEANNAAASAPRTGRMAGSP